MLDIKAIREDPEPFRKGLARRNLADAVDALLAADERRRSLIGRVEELRAEQNHASKAIGGAHGRREAAPDRRGEQGVRRAQGARARAGGRRGRARPSCSRGPRTCRTRARPTGSPTRTPWRFAVTASPRRSTSSRATTWRSASCSACSTSNARSGRRGRGSSTCSATSCSCSSRSSATRSTSSWRRGFTPVIPPVLVREEAMYGTGFLPTDEAQLYMTARGRPVPGRNRRGAARRAAHGRDPRTRRICRCATPAYSTCFRREAGTYGKDLGGMFRVHQFDKVEMFSFTHAGDLVGRARAPGRRSRRRSSATSRSRTAW